MKSTPSEYTLGIKNDNALIRSLQDRWFSNRKDETALSSLINAIENCARRMIHHQREMKGFFMSNNEVKEKAHTAALYILEQYLSRPDFKLGTPSGYIHLRVMAVLYGRAEQEKQEANESYEGLYEGITKDPRNTPEENLLKGEGPDGYSRFIPELPEENGAEVFILMGCRVSGKPYYKWVSRATVRKKDLMS